MIDTADAQGRLKNRSPIGVIDIGSNSVRLVIFEGLVRAPSILFNEKVSCGLGRGIASANRMDDTAIEEALAALVRYRALADQGHVSRLHVLATAAAREAENGPDFVARAEDILREKINILTGREEALYSALGVVSAFRDPDGVAGDMGGGSLELVSVNGTDIGSGATVPLGGIRLLERAEGSVETARAIAAEDLKDHPALADGKDRTFYAIGGTWRNIAKLHMDETNYPLHVTHNYVVETKMLIEFCDRMATEDVSNFKGIKSVSKSRRALLPYGAVVLSELLKAMKPAQVAFSAQGVREGFLFSLLDNSTQKKDGLLEAADELAVLRSRSPRHARELSKWTGQAFKAFGIDETEDEARWREAACRLADVGWRAHPDYRAAQSLAVIAFGSFIQVSHEGRAFLALANYFRYEGIKAETLAPEIKQLTSERTWERSKLLGGFLRVAYLFTAAMPGVVDKLKWEKNADGSMSLILPKELMALDGERPRGRISQLSKVTGVEIDLKIV